MGTHLLHHPHLVLHCVVLLFQETGAGVEVQRWLMRRRAHGHQPLLVRNNK
jgi:hypothetical protein